MKVEGVDNEITGNSLRARSKERKIDRALICLTASLQNRKFRVEEHDETGVTPKGYHFL